MQPSMWPVTNQERELWCVRHITDEPHVQHLQPEVNSIPLSNLYLTGVVQNHVCAEWLRKNGFVVLSNDGVKVVYC